MLFSSWYFFVYAYIYSSLVVGVCFLFSLWENVLEFAFSNMPILSLYLHRYVSAIGFMLTQLFIMRVITCFFVKSNYLIPRTQYVKAFRIAFHLLMFDCNSNRISFSECIKEKLQFLEVKMLILLKTMIVIFTFEMSFVRCV